MKATSWAPRILPFTCYVEDLQEVSVTFFFFFVLTLNVESVQCTYICGKRHAPQSAKYERGRHAKIGDSKPIHPIPNYPISNSPNHFGH